MSAYDPSAVPAGGTLPGPGAPSGTDWKALAGALGDAAKGLQQSQGQGVQNIAASSPQGSSGDQPSSQVVPGNPSTMGRFTELLLDHIAKLQAASNPLAGARPITSGRSGLLGL